MIWTRDDKPWWHEAAKAAAVALATTIATEGIKIVFAWLKESLPGDQHKEEDE